MEELLSLRRAEKKLQLPQALAGLAGLPRLTEGSTWDGQMAGGGPLPMVACGVLPAGCGRGGDVVADGLGS